jgi:hypothetical protein
MNSGKDIDMELKDRLAYLMNRREIVNAAEL